MVLIIAEASQGSQEALSIGPSPTTPHPTPLVLGPFPHLSLKWVSVSVWGGYCWPSSDSSSLTVGMSSKGQNPGLGVWRYPPIPPVLGLTLSLTTPMGGQACAGCSCGSVEMAWARPMPVASVPSLVLDASDPEASRPSFLLSQLGMRAEASVS